MPSESPQTEIANPAGWPAELLPFFAQALTVEYTSLTRAGQPIAVPITPYLGDNGRTLDVSTGLTYPAKAERARRNPKVALLFADPIGSGLENPPIVLVQGMITVRDRDLQANTDRYVRETLGKLPAAFKGMPRFLLRRLNWYFSRIWIEVTPTRIYWWESKELDEEPKQWIAPPGIVAPPSDPTPAGKQPPAWLEPPTDWRTTARHAIDHLDQRDLTWVGADGFPISVPAMAVDDDPQGFRLRLGRHMPGLPQGAGCLTFHSHPAVFSGQENHTFVGEVSAAGEEATFRVERLLADISLTGNKLTMMLNFLRQGRRLSPRLSAEASRRGQTVPIVNLPQRGH